MLKNKKADLSVVLLVFLALTVCCIALLIFITSETLFKKKLLEVNDLNSFYSENKRYEIYFGSLAKQVILKNKNMGNQEFLDLFKKTYIETCPDEFKKDYLIQQIQENSKYNLLINEFGLTLILDNFRFVKEYAVDSKKELRIMQQVKDIKIEIGF